MFNLEELRDNNAICVQEILALNDVEKRKEYASNYENRIKEIVTKEELTPMQLSSIECSKTAVLWTIIDKISSLN